MHIGFSSENIDSFLKKETVSPFWTAPFIMRPGGPDGSGSPQRGKNDRCEDYSEQPEMPARMSIRPGLKPGHYPITGKSLEKRGGSAKIMEGQEGS